MNIASDDTKRYVLEINGNGDAFFDGDMPHQAYATERTHTKL